MKTIQTFFFLLFIASSLFSQTTSPDVIITSGEVIESEEGSISWTIGENLIETVSESDLNLLQGYQEVEDMPLPIEEVFTIDDFILVFPTQTESIVNVVFNEKLNVPFKAYLLDISGKRCADYEFDLQYNQIDLSEYSYGMYLLNITNEEGQLIQEFKLFRH